MKFFADVKHQEIKGLVAVSRNVLYGPLAKFEMQYKTVTYFLLNLPWYFTQLDIVH